MPSPPLRKEHRQEVVYGKLLLAKDAQVTQKDEVDRVVRLLNYGVVSSATQYSREGSQATTISPGGMPSTRSGISRAFSTGCSSDPRCTPTPTWY